MRAAGGDVAEVAVGDGQAGVAELVLDEVDRVALFDQFGGVGVAQAVGIWTRLSMPARAARRGSNWRT